MVGHNAEKLWHKWLQKKKKKKKKKQRNNVIVKIACTREKDRSLAKG